MGLTKVRWGQFFKDQAFSLGLVVAIGMPIMALILWVMDSIGTYWGLAAWAILMSFSLLIELVIPHSYRTVIQ